MDGVMVVTDDEQGSRSDAGRLFQRLGDAYRKERFVILREGLGLIIQLYCSDD